MNNPLVNILIRTSNRKEGFERLLWSIESSSYKNVNIIVSYDTPVKPKYIPDNLRAISVAYLTPERFKEGNGAWYNLYCNELMKQVKDGYIIFIDDDDYIRNYKALEAIVRRLNPGKANVIQMTRNGRKKPLKDEIVSGKLGMPCLILHNKHKNLAKFDGTDNADYKFINKVAGLIGHKFIPIALVEAGQRGMGKV